MTVQTLIPVSGLYDSVLALVYPQACAVCGDSVESRHDGVACAGCWAGTRVFNEGDTVCWKCGALSLGSIAREKRDTVRCGQCDNDEFTHARACGLYAGALRASVLALKREPHVARRLAKVLWEAQKRSPLNNAEVIVPVPLHPDRERARGFNQAALLAHELARLTHLAVDEYSVARSLHTERHRAGMDAKARRESVDGAFVVRHPKLISGRRVLLVDDVFTTGATVSACAAVLKEAGAAEVNVLTIARAGSS
ncbi:MAG TPA: ComF family protein [Pyrinomonadaceae bacterium]|nr:ComF family protein [Pyrinomonadaceae bacterium]